MRFNDTNPAGYGLVVLVSIILLAGCAKPYVHPSNGENTHPQLTQSYALMADGYRLPVSRWEAAGSPRAIVLALHGLNDYSFAFDSVGNYLAQRGITIIAYDQRGFGKTSGQGLWHGGEQLSEDLVTMTRLIKQQYSEVPLYLLGESMGGAVVLMTLASNKLDIEGATLVAPAVWSRDFMPFYQRAALWVAANTMPSRLLTGDGLDIQPSDNVDMLKALSEDELVIKATRVDVLYGVSNLMDTAMLASSDVHGNILLMYGKHDEIIPVEPTCKLLERLSDNNPINLDANVYEQGYHMLTRDMQAEVVLQDIAKWIIEHKRPVGSAKNMHVYCARMGRG
jgi:alpha-beta hydrolase superfamily lysophospholipase